MAASSPPMIRSAAFAALLAALLALPLLGVRLVDSATGLSLSGRPELVAWAAGGVFCGRLMIDLFRRWLADYAIRLPVLPAPPDWTRFGVGWAMALFALVLPFLPFADRNLVDKATMVLIYIMLGWGLNIVVGLAGLLDLGFVAFYAVGAYSYALLSLTFGLSFWICLPLAGLFAAAFGLALGFPVLRLRGDYLAIVTLGFGEIIRIILQNWQDLTGGPIGISGIERPSLFGLSFKAVPPEGQISFAAFFGLDYSPDHRVIFLYFLILILALATNLFTLRIRRLPVGRAWEALREDEIACRSLGINPTTIKLSAFALGAMFAGFAGSFFATRQGFISPESFTFIESAMILAIVVLGGMGSQIGIVLAALLLVGLPEWFRDLQMYRMLAFGAAMVLIMLWKPSGLLSSRSPTVRLGGRA
ncbi:high-affinity branched-chain amino acid ABC transporter permease LivM [Magnetospirillum fulvum]|uniref:ABC-type branched-chain amino acid transport system, permease component n=1 Tax=Magnetospirillum fulvum MGU-K5 TaxID=1316936 RepID=S9SCU7_MAGFU|nr:high-affinity branched-chain amino acid ABC transporter permease LivM [Magnetospirillum fulvum]EPY01898.1 ABC-type branched-chain amino acid transport system, permease component [Magnetospirillum fulvum MGU-K5]